MWSAAPFKARFPRLSRINSTLLTTSHSCRNVELNISLQTAGSRVPDRVASPEKFPVLRQPQRRADSPAAHAVDKSAQRLPCKTPVAQATIHRPHKRWEELRQRIGENVKENTRQSPSFPRLDVEVTRLRFRGRITAYPQIGSGRVE